MKRIKIKKGQELPIETWGPNRGQYKITLYWNQVYYFTAKKDALRFIAIANQFYTQSMYEGREIFIDVWVKYQRDWGYFQNETSAFELAKMNRDCKDAMNTCQESFDMMADRSDYENGHFLVRRKLELVIEHMHRAVKILKEINKKHSGSSGLYSLDTIARRIYAFEFSIKSFGDYEAKNLNKRPMHESYIPASTLVGKAKINVA